MFPLLWLAQTSCRPWGPRVSWILEIHICGCLWFRISNCLDAKLWQWQLNKKPILFAAWHLAEEISPEVRRAGSISQDPNLSRPLMIKMMIICAIWMKIVLPLLTNTPVPLVLLRSSFRVQQPTRGTNRWWWWWWSWWWWWWSSWWWWQSPPSSSSSS